MDGRAVALKVADSPTSIIIVLVEIDTAVSLLFVLARLSTSIWALAMDALSPEPYVARIYA